MKRVALFEDEKKSLIIFSFFMPKNLFWKRLFAIKYILKNKIMAIILANTYTIRYSSIDKKFVETGCQVFEI